ncbi:helix-turn-helix transcriptional regulator [Bacillus massiliglaciei]|uniref:helix-turn-helix transcriptional regulator n=1 Tax=Bacillus massiliglaciei TaxID=1816693 RepID=UPI000AD351B4|nr:helix-turn-helix transcriptional regulator [Bacillus massiliglaciei]
MTEELSYTIEEVAKLLKVSKLTVYDLVKKGQLPIFRVGRQMRMDAKDLERYILQNKSHPSASQDRPSPKLEQARPLHKVISGQDMALDILGKQIEKQSSYKVLRSYTGSLNSLISMYSGECDIVSLHLFDGETGEYNLPYVKKILVSRPYLLIRLISRLAGLFVPEGNPMNISSWEDLKRKDITIMNREKGSGARVLLDEQLRIHGISSSAIQGYDQEESSHLSVASAISNGHANLGVGIEKAARIVGVDFIPLITEQYDLVILKSPENEELIETVKRILTSPSFQAEIQSLGGYDLTQTGKVLHETF